MVKHSTLLELKEIYARQNFVVEDCLYKQQLADHPMVKNLWTIGHYFVVVSNLSSWLLEVVSGECEEVSGYSAAEILSFNVEFLVQFSLPEDARFNLQVTELGMEYYKSKAVEERDLIFMVYFCQAKRKDGKVITIQHKSIPLCFDKNKVPFVFSNIYTDVSYLGISQVPQALKINHYTHEVFHIHPQSLKFCKSEVLFSAREQEIIKLLLKGNNSRFIAEQLFISQETVRTHRKNILKKAGLNNTVELLSYALTRGIV